MATYSALPATLNLVATVGNDFSLALTVTENGSPWVATGATLATDIIDSSGAVVATDFTTAASTGAVSLSLTDTQTGTLGVGVYSYRLSVTKSSLTRDWIAGTLSIVEAGVGGRSTSDVSLAITDTTISLTLNSMVASNAANIIVADAAGYYNGDDVEEVLAELPSRFTPVFNPVAYGNSLSSAISACQTAGGGIVEVPEGEWVLTSGVEITGAFFDNDYNLGGVTLRGVSQTSSIIRVNSGITAVTITNGTMCHIENLSLVGPGKATASSRGLFVDGPPSNLTIRNVLVREFETGIQFDDVTVAVCTDVYVRDCGKGWAFGYNQDGTVFIGCRADYCDVGVTIGYQTAAHNTQTQYTSGLTWIGGSISLNTLGWFVNDQWGMGINFQGTYFESNTKEGEVGVSGRTDSVSPIGLTFDDCMWSYGAGRTPGAIGIDLFNSPSVIFRGCVDDGAQYEVFVKANNSSAVQVTMEDCGFSSTVADLQVGTRNYLTRGRTYKHRIDWGHRQINLVDLSNVQYDSGAWIDNRAYQFADRTLESWSRYTTSESLVNQFSIVDANGILKAQGQTDSYIAATSRSALPTASSSLRGCIAFVAGSTGVADVAYVCLKDSSDAYAWVAVDNNGLATRAQNHGGLPTGALAQTIPRNTGVASTSVLTSGTERLALIWLDAGMTITNISFQSGSTGLTSGTNQWFSLRSSARVLLGITADATTAAWSAGSTKTLALSTPYTVTVSGYYYLGCMVAATTPPHLQCATGVLGLAPIIAGSDTTNTGLTTPATAPATSAALTAGSSVPYAYVS